MKPNTLSKTTRLNTKRSRVTSILDPGTRLLPGHIPKDNPGRSEENGEEEAKARMPRTVSIAPPNFSTAVFHIRGTAPLVIHRFDEKTKNQMRDKMEAGKSASSKKNREARLTEDLFNAARYTSAEGWDGFHAGSIRNALISACRLVSFKMTLAKMSLFVIADGMDAKAPQIPLVRILGNPIKQEDIARVETGQPYVTVRAAYHNWGARVRIRWDADQFSLQDVTNLLARVGMQVGIGEGRPDSKNSAGLGWGTFEIINEEQK